jgi:adenylyltransferase/sulfurtransferase
MAPEIENAIQNKLDIYVICRLGNDSQLATRYLKDKYGVENIKDIVGGLNSWSLQVDSLFPRY